MDLTTSYYSASYHVFRAGFVSLINDREAFMQHYHENSAHMHRTMREDLAKMLCYSKIFVNKSDEELPLLKEYLDVILDHPGRSKYYYDKFIFDRKFGSRSISENIAEIEKLIEETSKLDEPLYDIFLHEILMGLLLESGDTEKIRKNKDKKKEFRSNVQKRSFDRRYVPTSKK